MSDRKFRRSDVIARDNREKRVTRVSRQRLKGLIEEAVENIINEGYVEQLDKDWCIQNIPDDFMNDFNSWKDNVKVYKLTCDMVNDVCRAFGVSNVRVNCDRVIPLLKYHYGEGRNIETISYAKGLYVDDIRFPATIPPNRVSKLVTILHLVYDQYGFRDDFEVEDGKYFLYTRNITKESVMSHDAMFFPSTILDTEEEAR